MVDALALRTARRLPGRTPRGHTRCVTSALRSEALAPLRDDPAHAAVLFDLDGTLAPIAAQPSEARVPEQSRHLLIEIQHGDSPG